MIASSLEAGARGLVLLAVSLLVSPLAGQDRDAPGPPHVTNLRIGELPPSAFVLESIDGQGHDLAAQRGQRPLLLLFFRGTW